MLSFKSGSRQKKSTFDIVTSSAAILVALFVFAALGFLVIRGVPYFGETLKSDEVRFAIGLSLKTALLSTAVCLVLGVPAAYALSRPSSRSGNLLAAIIELPLSVPNIMLGLSLLLMFSSVPGKFLSAHGVKVIFNVSGIVLAHILVNMPFVIRMVKTAFMNVDRRYEIVAGSLGAGSFRTFLLVTLPLAKNAVIGAGVLAWSRALGEFGATLMLVGATRMKTETIPTSIYLNMATGDMGPAMACAMILLIISGISLFITNRLNKAPGEQNEHLRR